MRSKPAAIGRISSFGPQPNKVPSHYALLLINAGVAQGKAQFFAIAHG
jgi:hypothetical protein